METRESLLSMEETGFGGRENEDTFRKLAECAYEFPESREEMAAALEAYAERAKTSKERNRASSIATEIRAITMLETLASEL